MNHEFRQVVDRLPSILESEHFILRYGLRNPSRGVGLGPHGVPDPVLVRSYQGSLERLYHAMRQPPWNRPAPRVGVAGKTMVYICDVSAPFTATDFDGNPFIVLQCRSHEPMNDAAMRRAAAEAVHEATHVFNCTERPLREPYSDWWAWFDEGLAVYMESRVLPGNHDYFRYLPNWIDLPGIPLNQWESCYQACLFLHYLSSRLGPEFLNRVWTESRRNEKPLEALCRLLPADLSLACSSPTRRDLFASEYAVGSYFLRDHESGCFAPELCARFGERAIVASHGLSRGDQIVEEGELPHLACHYFRFYPRRNVEALRFVLHPGGGAASDLKVQVAIASPEFHCSRCVTLGRDPGSGEALVAELEDLAGHPEVHHVVLVVTNCHLEELARIPRRRAYRGESYRIEITAS